MEQDNQHLNMLAIFHYVMAGLTAFGSLFPIIYVVLGIAIVSGNLPMDHGDPLPEFLGWFIMAMGIVMTLVALAGAIAIALAGLRLQRRRWHTYCLVVAAIQCLFFPIGTLLGVFTILVLVRPSVRKQFGVAADNQDRLPPAMTAHGRR